MEGKPAKNLIPNSTQVPNVILDFVIPGLPEAEGKCLLYICRRTFGFHKEQDRISFSQFERGIKDKSGKQLDYGTGLRRAAVARGLAGLVHAGAVSVSKDSKGNFYKINLDLDPEEVVRKANQFRKETRTSSQMRPKQVRLWNSQKKGNQEKQSSLQTALPSAGNENEHAEKAERKPYKPHTPHRQFIEFWHEEVKATRRIKPIITGADARNLQRVLKLGIEEPTLEKLAVYFLHEWSFKKFSPSIATFLSSGILNGLQDRFENDQSGFWKVISQADARPVSLPTKLELDSMKRSLAAMKTMFAPQARTSIQEAVAREERAAKR